MSEEQAIARPYVHLLEGQDPADVLRATPARLGRVLGAMAPEQIEYKPAPNKWSIREILCHMADCEVAWAWRLRSIHGSDNPTMQPFEQDAWAKAYDGPGYTVDAARTTWMTLRRWNLNLIETLSEEQKRRPAHHPELGDITLWTVVEIAAGHDVHHLDQLERVSAKVHAQ
ncbi:MAG: DinB family protein [Janthinobacterium lividum]